MVGVMVNYSSGRDQNFDLGLGGLISFSVSNSRPNVWAYSQGQNFGFGFDWEVKTLVLVDIEGFASVLILVSRIWFGSRRVALVEPSLLIGRQEKNV